MDEMDRIATELETLAATMRAALAAGDIGALTAAVNAREGVVARCGAHLARLSAAERQACAPRLQTTMAVDNATLTAGLAWLRATRGRLRQLQTGARTLRGYGAAPGALPRAAVVDLAC